MRMGAIVFGVCQDEQDSHRQRRGCFGVGNPFHHAIDLEMFLKLGMSVHSICPESSLPTLLLALLV
jgi:hypothetical protein